MIRENTQPPVVSCSNVPIERLSDFGIQRREGGGEEERKLLTLDVVCKKMMPSLSIFVVETVGFNSLKKWPVALKTRLHVLSEAGLFYTGSGDEMLFSM